MKIVLIGYLLDGYQLREHLPTGESREYNQAYSGLKNLSCWRCDLVWEGQLL